MTGNDSSVVLSLDGIDVDFLQSNGTVSHALRAVTFAIQPQDRFVALIGPDGAGKSTLMRVLCGLQQPTRGKIFVLGHSPNADNEGFLSHLSFMPQSLGLYMDLTCWENLELFAELRGAIPGKDPQQLSQRIREMLTLTGLNGFEHRRAGQLSGGMKQKLALASALIKTPDLLLLDEPTVGVDPLSRRQLWAVVKQMIATTSMHCFFSTGYIEEAAMAQRVLFLEEGRLLADGEPKEFRDKAKGRCFGVKFEYGNTKGCARNLLLDVQAVREDSPLLDVMPTGNTMNLVVAPGKGIDDAAQAVALAGMDVRELHARVPSLQDAYAILTLEHQGCRGDIENRNLASRDWEKKKKYRPRVSDAFLGILWL